MNDSTSPSDLGPDAHGKRHSLAARMTGGQRGAVATVRLWDRADVVTTTAPPLFRSRRNVDLGKIPVGELVLGDWGPTPSEEVVLCRINPQLMEIHCHGGEQAVARIAESLRQIGVQWIDWQTLRHEEHGLLAAEWGEALAQASTSRTAAIVLKQQGRFQQVVDILRKQSERCTVPRGAENPRQSAERELIARLAELDRWSTFGRHLSRPWDVVLAGRTNVGKSSLINALVGFERSIVSDQPGTTRDVVTAETACAGWPIRFNDTAGLRSTVDALESEGIQRASERFSLGDARLLLFDVSQPIGQLELQLLQDYPDAIAVAHKSDLSIGCDLGQIPAALRVSSRTGQGVPELLTRIAETVVPELPPDDATFPLNSRQANLVARARRHAVESRWELVQQDLADLARGA